MTKDQFMHKYAAYMTRDDVAAKLEAEKVNAAGLEGGPCVAVQFGDLWCLMLKSAHEFTKELGIESKT